MIDSSQVQGVSKKGNSSNMSISHSMLLQSRQNWTYFFLSLYTPQLYDVSKYTLTTTKQLASLISIQFYTLLLLELFC